jgi:hypothetical protein
MAKIIDEPVILRYEYDIEGNQVPVYSCKVETTITNTRTGLEYDSEDHANNDIADPNTDTTPKIFVEMLMSSPLNYSQVRLHQKKDNEKCNKRSTLKFMNLD